MKGRRNMYATITAWAQVARDRRLEKVQAEQAEKAAGSDVAAAFDLLATMNKPDTVLSWENRQRRTRRTQRFPIRNSHLLQSLPSAANPC